MAGNFKAHVSLLFFLALGVVVLAVPMEGTTIPNALEDRANPLEFLTETFGIVPVAFGCWAIGVGSWIYWSTLGR